ncbi:MAG: hypothetical protein WC523_01135 [Patescibacteria group bacterium]|jgi:hypothetical protein
MKTKPKHVLDWTLWPILKIFFKPFSKKSSYAWQWLDYSAKRQAILDANLFIKLDADPLAQPVKTIWSNFYQRNFGWKRVVRVVAYKNHSLWAKEFQIGYISGEDCKLCSLILTGITGVLIGDQTVIFFAVDLQGKILSIKNCGLTDKKEKIKII